MYLPDQSMARRIGDLQGRIQEFRKGGGGGGGVHRKGVGAGGGCAPSRAKRGSFEQYSNTDTHS